MFVYKVEEEGVFVVEVIVGEKLYIDYNFILGVVYIWLEVVSVGQIEEQFKEVGIFYKFGKFLFKVLGWVWVSIDIEGMVKILVYKEIDEVFGVYMVGLCIVDMIVEVVMVMEFWVFVEDIVWMSYVYFIYIEVIKEVVLVVMVDWVLYV